MSEAEIFSGRVVSLWAKDPAKGGVLESARIRHLGQRAFVVGQLTGEKDDDDPRVGLTFWFPIDDLLLITEFPDIETARRYYRGRQELKARQKQKAGLLSRLWGRNKSH